MFEVDNYSGVVNKFDTNLAFVDTLSACLGPVPPLPGTCADWNGLPDTPFDFQAPSGKAEFDILASAVGFMASGLQLSDISTRQMLLPVLDCLNQSAPPTIVAVPESEPEPSGWTKALPVVPDPMSFTVTLSAADPDLSGDPGELRLNLVPVARFQPDGGDEGATTILFRAQDANFVWSAPGELTLYLDNTFPNIRFCIPYGVPQPVTNAQGQVIGFRYWWNSDEVRIPVSVFDNWDQNPSSSGRRRLSVLGRKWCSPMKATDSSRAWRRAFRSARVRWTRPRRWRCRCRGTTDRAVSCEDEREARHGEFSRVR